MLHAVMEALKDEEGARVWIREVNEMTASEQHARWRQLITRVEVGRGQLRITVDPKRHDEQGTGQGDQSLMPVVKILRQGQGRVLEVPWAITRRGGRTELRLKGAPVRTPAQPHAGFVTAVGRAFQWKDELLAGKVSTIQALAHREGLTRRYVMRVLRLSFLAPDLIDAILAGQRPLAFTLEPFRRPIPLEWAVQRKFFGFPPVVSRFLQRTWLW